MTVADRSFSARLFDVYRRLREHFSYARRWWPGTTSEVVFTAILVQQTDWAAAWSAVKRMRNESLASLGEVAAADEERIRRCIHGVAFGPTKSRRLRRIAQRLQSQGFETVEDYLESWSSTGLLRSDLLTWEGVGKETADCIVSFAAGGESFVIDNYTRRIFRRLALFPELDTGFWDGPYEQIKDFFQSHISDDLRRYDGFEFTDQVTRKAGIFRDYHAQLVELGSHHCQKQNPRCRERGRLGWRDYGFCRVHCANDGCASCPLVEICKSGKSSRNPVPR